MTTGEAELVAMAVAMGVYDPSVELEAAQGELRKLRIWTEAYPALPKEKDPFEYGYYELVWVKWGKIP